MALSEKDNLINELFESEKKGGGYRRKNQNKQNQNQKQNKQKDGGIKIAPFLSALALLGTRIINDKRFLNSKKNPINNLLKQKKRGGNGDMTQENFNDLLPAAPPASDSLLIPA